MIGFLMALTLLIDGVDQTARITAQTLKVSTPAIGRSQLDVTILSDDLYRAEKGMTIRLEDAGLPKFGGFIDSIEESGALEARVLAGPAIDQVIVAVDNNWLADRIYVTKIIAPGSTLRDILDEFVSGSGDDLNSAYGVTRDPAMPPGPTIDAELNFTDLQISGWFTRVAEFCAQAGTPVVIQIDADLILSGYAVGSRTTPWDIEDDDGRVDGPMFVKASDREYHNRVKYKFGPSATHDITDNFTGDGTTDTYVLSAQIVGHIPGSNPSGSVGYSVVVINGTSTESISIAGTGGTLWEYTHATKTIVRVAGAPANGDTIAITYQASSPSQVMVEDAGEIASRGLNEIVIRDEYTTTAAMALALAQSALAKFLEQPRIIRYPTLSSGLEAGMVQHIQNTKHDLDIDALIVDLDLTDEGGTTLLYDVTLEEGSRFRGSWRDVPIAWLAGGGGGAAGSAGITPVPGAGGFLFSGIPHPQGFQSAGTGSIYVRTDGSGRMYRKLGGASTAYGWYLQTWIGEHGHFSLWATAASTAAGSVGQLGSGAALTGALTAPGASVNGFYGNVARLETSAAANSNANIRPSTGSTINVGNEFDLVCVIRMSSDLTSQRIWIGLDENGGPFNNGDTPGAGIARYAFRFSSAAGDTGWRGQVSDGTTTNTTANIGTVVADTRYILRIRGDRSTGGGTNPTIFFSVNNGSEVSLAGVPNADEQMELGVSIWNLVASARFIYWERIAVLDGIGLSEAM